MGTCGVPFCATGTMSWVCMYVSMCARALAHLLLLLFSVPCQLSLFILLFDHPLFLCLEIESTGSWCFQPLLKFSPIGAVSIQCILPSFHLAYSFYVLDCLFAQPASRVLSVEPSIHLLLKVSSVAASKILCFPSGHPFLEMLKF